jgi:hypothetical protein
MVSSLEEGRAGNRHFAFDQAWDRSSGLSLCSRNDACFRMAEADEGGSICSARASEEHECSPPRRSEIEIGAMARNTPHQEKEACPLDGSCGSPGDGAMGRPALGYASMWPSMMRTATPVTLGRSRLPCELTSTRISLGRRISTPCAIRTDSSGPNWPCFTR